MIVLRDALLGALISLSTSAAAAPSPEVQAIAAVLDYYAHDSSDERSCVMPTLEPAINDARGSGRDSYSEWLTVTDNSVAPSTARMLDRAIAASTHGTISRIARAPRPMVLATTDAPTTGPCALETDDGKVWQFFLSRPAISGNLAFVEVTAVADGKNPPPQLLALEMKHGHWRLAYRAHRTIWYD